MLPAVAIVLVGVIPPQHRVDDCIAFVASRLEVKQEVIEAPVEVLDTGGSLELTTESRPSIVDSHPLNVGPRRLSTRRGSASGYEKCAERPRQTQVAILLSNAMNMGRLALAIARA